MSNNFQWSPGTNIGANALYGCTASLSTDNIPNALYQWYNNAGAITGATNDSYANNATDQYYCRVTLNSVTRQTVAVNFTYNCPPRMENAADNTFQGLLLYPNPGENQYSVEINNNSLSASELRFRIFNNMGKLLFDKRINVSSGTQTLQWQMPDNSISGLYFIEIELNNKIYKSSFIKIAKP